MVRGVLGFVAGGLVWMPVFFVLARVVALAWPAYGAHGRVWFESGVYGFEPTMSVVNVVCWALSQVVAGWVTVAIARRQEPAWILAPAIALYLGFLHLYLYWPRFPWWYNVAVAAVAAPAVLFGGRLAARRRADAHARHVARPPA